MIEATSTLNTVVLVAIGLYAIVGAFVIGSWLGSITFNLFELAKTKRQLHNLENKIKLAELKAREIQAGL